MTPGADQQAFRRHDHSHCADGVLGRVEALARDRGLRLTPVRRRTLEILLEAHRAMGAYDVLQRLAAEGFGNQPPVAYRALEFLEDHGLAHRIRRLNAFAACMHPGEAHAPAFLICRACNRVAEAPAAAVGAALAAAAAAAGFTVERSNVEATGLCPACGRAA
jgi:Fur family zinc uptake transcriptional regulator